MTIPWAAAADPIPQAPTSAADKTAARKTSSHKTADFDVTFKPDVLVNGAPIFIELKSAVPLRSLRATFLGHDLTFTSDASQQTWSALAGVSLKTSPGTYAIEFTAEKARGEPLTFSRSVSVKAGHYRTVALSVARKFTEPSPADLGAIKTEEALKKEVFAKVSADREWSGGFHPPIAAPDVRISDQFGTQRKFNGKVQSVHQGLDYAVPQGTTILAANSGTVVLAEPLFFEGNCVMIDHGQGLMTLYMHLSELKVKDGEHVQRGQPIGLSGATGRATGAHLHIAVRWQGTYLDPATLFALPLPADK